MVTGSSLPSLVPLEVLCILKVNMESSIVETSGNIMLMEYSNQQEKMTLNLNVKNFEVSTVFSDINIEL